MSLFSAKRHDVEDDLRAQVAELRGEVSALTRKLSKRGSVAYEGSRDMAGDAYDEVSRRVREALPMLRRRAGDVEQKARENPALAVAVGLAVVGLAISFIAAKRSIPDISPFDE